MSEDTAEVTKRPRKTIVSPELRKGKLVFADAPIALTVLKALDDFKGRKRFDAEMQFQQAQELRERRDNLARQIQYLQRDFESRGAAYTKEQVKKLDTLKVELEEVKAEIADVVPVKVSTQKLTGDEKQRWRIISELNGPAPEVWLAGLSERARFADFAPQLPKMKRGEVRNRKAKIVDEILAVRSAALDVSSVEHRIDENVRAIARGPMLGGVLTFRDRGGGLIRQGNLNWPTSIDPGRPDPGIAMLCWLFGDEIAARLKAEARKSIGRDGIGVEERKRREADLHAEFLELSRVEAHLCREAGEPVPEMNALAFFGIVRVEDAPIPVNPDAGGILGTSEPTMGVKFPEDVNRGFTPMPNTLVKVKAKK